MRQDEIMEILKDEFPDVDVKSVIYNFWKGLRYYLVNPIESKGKIMLGKFASFNIREVRIRSYITVLETRNYVRQKVKQENLDFYNTLLKTISKHERQEKVEHINQ